MMWRRSINYHGGRDYGTDLPGFSTADRISLTIAWLSSWTKRAFKRLLGSGSYPSATAAILLEESGRQLARHDAAARSGASTSGDRTFVDGSGQFPQLSSLRAGSGQGRTGEGNPPLGE